MANDRKPACNLAAFVIVAALAGLIGALADGAEPAGQPASSVPAANPHWTPGGCVECHGNDAQQLSPVKRDAIDGLCLKCHDGSRAPREIHPVGRLFVPGEIELPAGWPAPGDRLGCVTCHDIRSACDRSKVRPEANPLFLRRPSGGTRGGFCGACHTGAVQVAGGRYDPHRMLNEKGEVLTDACLFCHESFLDMKNRTAREGNARLRADGVSLCIGCHSRHRDYFEPGHIGIEANKEDIYTLFRDILSDEPDIKVDLMEVKYPQGAEHQLIKALLNREFKPTQLPLEVGAIVINVGTAFAVYEAVKFKRPLIQRIVTVTGNGVENPQNFLVRLGTPIKHLLEEARVVSNIDKIIFGGPMMGIAQGNIDTAVTIKGTGGILAFKGTQQRNSHACIRCGRCIDSCPYGLNPSILSIQSEAKEFNLALENNVMECKECGCCTYICPAKRPIVHLIKFAKAEIAKQKAQKATPVERK